MCYSAWVRARPLLCLRDKLETVKSQIGFYNVNRKQENQSRSRKYLFKITLDWVHQLFTELANCAFAETVISVFLGITRDLKQNKYVSVSVFFPIRGAQLAPLRGRRELSDPGTQQQTLVARLTLQFGRDRLRSRFLHRKDSGMFNHGFLTFMISESGTWILTSIPC